MKIIDAHLHYSNISAFFSAARASGADYSPEGYLREREAAGIVAGICMGVTESTPRAFPDREAGAFMTADLAAPLPPGMSVCLGINPHRLDDEAIARLKRKAAEDPAVRGFKIYAGYYHVHAHDRAYHPVYRLAAELGLAVAIHTGDTYSESALLEYSHPLSADRLAVAFRDVNFLLCHMGDPWIMDACEVAYKNRNVYLDTSGLIAGDDAQVKAVEGRPRVMAHYAQGLEYLNDYKKALFGTDWPIAPMRAYVDFCKKIIPESAWNDVFFRNAARLYGMAVEG